MKHTFRLVALSFFAFSTFAQKIIVPESVDINTSFLRTGTSLYTTYYVKGTIWTKKGSFTNDLSISGDQLRLVADYKDQDGKWYRKRTSLANATTLAIKTNLPDIFNTAT